MFNFLRFLFLSFLLANFIHSSIYAETSINEFDKWLTSYKKFALRKGISQDTLNVAFKDVKFLEQVIKYDRKQPEFFEDTKTYVGKRANISRAKTARKLLKM